MKNLLYAGAGTGILRFPGEYFPSDGYWGIHDDMHVKVLLLSQGEERGAVVTLELPSIRPWELTDALRLYAAQLLDVPYENLWLVMTHDLSAPHVPTAESGRTLHMAVLRDAVRTACEMAVSSLRPASVSILEGFCDVNANRDVESADGWWVGIDGNGPSDKSLSLLRFDDPTGSPIAMLYSYSLKSSVLEATTMSDGKRYASGDVTGVADAMAESELGCPVLFVMGAAGEQVPKKKANYLALDENRRFYTVNLQEKGYEILDELARELADAICTTARKTACPLSQELRFGQIAFHADGQVSYPKDLPEPPVLHYEYVPTPGEDIPVWYMQLGEAVLLGVKPEVVTPVFDEIREKSPFAHTLMAVLVNGGQGYIARDIDYDRYTYPGLKTPFFRGTDRIFIQEIVKCLEELDARRQADK